MLGFYLITFRRPYYRRGAGIGIWYGKRRRRRREAEDEDYQEQEGLQEPFRVLESIKNAREIYDEDD